MVTEAENSREFVTVEGLGELPVRVVVLDLIDADGDFERVVYDRAIGWSAGDGMVSVETENRRVHWYPLARIRRLETPLIPPTPEKAESD